MKITIINKKMYYIDNNIIITKCYYYYYQYLDHPITSTVPNWWFRIDLFKAFWIILKAFWIFIVDKSVCCRLYKIRCHFRDDKQYLNKTNKIALSGLFQF